MRIGLAFDLKPTVRENGGAAADESEEYDPPETIEALASSIERLGHQVVYLGGGRSFLEAVARTTVDLVFNIAEGRGTYRSRESQVPGILEMLGIPYTGSDPLALALCLDKPSAKLVARSAGINTPEFQVIESLDDLSNFQQEIVGFPLVVKPAFEGSSKGIGLHSRIDRPEDLAAAVRPVLQVYRQPVLLERFVPGKEVTVGVVGNGPPQVVGVMEVVPRGGPDERFMYTLEVKRNYRELVEYRCPPVLPPSCVANLEATALKLFKALGCRDMARLDFRVDRDNRAYFIEANPLPGLSPDYSDLTIMAYLCGWSYPRLIETILGSALRRYGLESESRAHHAVV